MMGGRQQSIQEELLAARRFIEEHVELNAEEDVYVCSWSLYMMPNIRQLSFFLSCRVMFFRQASGLSTNGAV